jgi:ATP-dependent Clp protease ATP-binding subunit ClpA
MLKVFRRLKYKIRDMGTISKLFKNAEALAQKHGEEMPGAEHFLLAALALPDNTAGNAFRRIGAEPSGFTDAINAQYHEALQSIGITAAPDLLAGDTTQPATEEVKLYQAKPSVQELMQQLIRLPSKNNMPLVGAHLVEVLASQEHGVTARALKVMGVDLAKLQAAAREESNNFAGQML